MSGNGIAGRKSTKEICAQYDVSHATVMGWVEEGCPVVNAGARHLYFEPLKVEQWLVDCGRLITLTPVTGKKQFVTAGTTARHLNVADTTMAATQWHKNTIPNLRFAEKCKRYYLEDVDIWFEERKAEKSARLAEAARGRGLAELGRAAQVKTKNGKTDVTAVNLLTDVVKAMQNVLVATQELAQRSSAIEKKLELLL